MLLNNSSVALGQCRVLTIQLFYTKKNNNKKCKLFPCRANAIKLNLIPPGSRVAHPLLSIEAPLAYRRALVQRNLAGNLLVSLFTAEESVSTQNSICL